MLKKCTVSVQLGQYEICIHDLSPEHSKDDQFFREPDHWWNIRRGESRVSIRSGSLQDHFVLRGLPKFGEEKEFTSLKDLDPHSSVHYVVTSKENGECFFFTAVRFRTDVFWILGSKNVRMVLREQHWREDLHRYGGQRYGYAISMASRFIEHEDIVTWTRQALVHRVTFCLESCNPATGHMVLYPEWKFYLFAAVPQVGHTMDQGYCLNWTELNAIKPQHAPTVCCLGLLYDLNALNACEKSVYESATLHEGAVVYEVNALTQCVQHVYKVKNRQYVMYRSVREILRKVKDHPHLTPEHEFDQRFQHHHVNPTAEEMSFMKQFFHFCLTCELDDAFFHNYPLKIQEFQALTVEQRQNFSAKSSPTPSGHLVMLVGPPGSGKTTLGQMASYLLAHSASQVHYEYIDQDMLGGKHQALDRFIQDFFHTKSFRTKRLVSASDPDPQECFAKQSSPPSRVLFLGKCNHTAYMRRRILSKLPPHVRVSIVNLVPPGDKSNQYIELLQQRIEQRSQHPSLSTQTPNWQRIVSDFVHEFQPPTEKEVSQYRLDVNIHDLSQGSIKERVSTLWSWFQPADGFESAWENAWDQFSLTGAASFQPTYDKYHYQFWGIRIQDPENKLQRIWEQNASLHSQVLMKEFHVTLLHRNEYVKCPQLWQAIRAWDQNEVEVTVTGGKYNDRIGALEVKVEVPGYNTNPHITLCKINSAQCVESNDMLVRNAEMIVGEFPLYLRGVVCGFV